MTRDLLAVTAGAAIAATAGVWLVAASGRSGIAVVASALLLACLVQWPWMTLPATIVGGLVVGTLATPGDVESMVAVHLVFLAIGGLAMTVRWLYLPGSARRQRTPVDLPMIVYALVVAASAVYGMIIGNDPYNVAIATYQLGVIPVYYFIATWTLNSRSNLNRAAIAFVIAVGLLTLISITAVNRHGGLLSFIAFAPSILMVQRTRGWRRLLWVGLTALFAVDIVLATFRSIWVAAATTLAVMLIWGRGVNRRGVLVALAASAAALGLSLVGLTGVRDRLDSVAEYMAQDGGYRIPEAIVGLGVFGDSPLVGGGLGQSVAQLNLDELIIIDVGPVYHNFYVLALANAGLIGLVALGWPIARAIRLGLLPTANEFAWVFSSLMCGFVVYAMFASPLNGHWEFGVLAALIALSVQFGSAQIPLARPTQISASRLIPAVTP